MTVVRGGQKFPQKGWIAVASRGPDQVDLFRHVKGSQDYGIDKGKDNIISTPWQIFNGKRWARDPGLYPEPMTKWTCLQLGNHQLGNHKAGTGAWDPSLRTGTDGEVRLQHRPQVSQKWHSKHQYSRNLPLE